MFGRKTGFLAAMVAAMMLFGGCGTAGNNLGGATGGGEDRVYSSNSGGNSGNTGASGSNTGTSSGNTGTSGYGTGSYSSGGTAYWDGYGVNSGREMFADNTERNTYGMRTDGGTLGGDMKNALENNPVTRAVEDVTSGRTRTNAAAN